MKRISVFVIVNLAIVMSTNAQEKNLISNADFHSLKSWTSNENLRSNGELTQIPEENAIMIFNPILDLDGYIYQDINVLENDRLYYTVSKKTGSGNHSSVAFVALDKKGGKLRTFVLTRDTSPKKVRPGYTRFEGTIQMPKETVKLRTVLGVLGGTTSYSDLILTRTTAEKKVSITSRRNLVPGKGFTVNTYSISRPQWKIHCDDLDKDGVPEIIACDVDGLVTVRQPGSPPTITYAAEALVYQFETADLENDGEKEILMSFVDPKIPIKAIDHSGKVVMEFRDIKGFQRISAADMDGDGNTELVFSIGNLINTSGLASGFSVYNNKAEKLWSQEENLRNFHFADILPDPGMEIVVGGPGIEFRIYNKEGEKLKEYYYENALLGNFSIADVNNDGNKEIIASIGVAEFHDRRMLCLNDGKVVWENRIDGQLGNPENLIAIGDFDANINGLETVAVSPHAVYLFDAEGTIIYQSRENKNWERWEAFMPDALNSLDIGFWNEKDPQLFLSSSKFKHAAYYQLKFGAEDNLKTYLLPDQEKHLEDFYHTLKQRPTQDQATKEKVKVFTTAVNILHGEEEYLRNLKTVLDTMEAPGLEYLFMAAPSDLLGHRRGNKMTCDEIIERARLLEELKIPFGFVIGHNSHAWTSMEAITDSKKVAPTMFRFIFIGEDFAVFYREPWKKTLKWIDKVLNFCAENNMQMVFKEKHDVWGLMMSDKEITDVLFNPKYKDVTVPIWSTNQPYQPEIQLGGMLGLKNSGLCNEFGMSTQHWNWHEWGRYPRGIRDVSGYSICPSDIILRLELMGISLGATWLQIEGGQPYFRRNFEDGLVPMAKRHRDLAYELVRKNILTPGATPDNLNRTTIVRSSHAELERGKSENSRILYPYYNRNTTEFRKGFIPARYMFEDYSEDAFPRMAYSLATNVSTCFPETPNGWFTIIPPVASLHPDQLPIYTDGEKVLIDKAWNESGEAAPLVKKTMKEGAEGLTLECPGTCFIVQKDDSRERVYTAIMIDPAYFAPTGVSTTLISNNGDILKATDLISGETLKFRGNCCPIEIQPGAFRIVKVELMNH